MAASRGLLPSKPVWSLILNTRANSIQSHWKLHLTEKFLQELGKHSTQCFYRRWVVPAYCQMPERSRSLRPFMGGSNRWTSFCTRRPVKKVLKILMSWQARHEWLQWCHWHVALRLERHCATYLYIRFDSGDVDKERHCSRTKPSVQRERKPKATSLRDCNRRKTLVVAKKERMDGQRRRRQI